MVFFSDLEIVEFTELLYLTVFSLVIGLQSAPCKGFQYLEDLKDTLCKYFRFLERWTFKGMALMFVGAALISEYYAVVHASMSWLGTLCGFCTVIVGVGTLAEGIRMTSKLQNLRLASKNRGANLPQGIIDPHTFNMFAGDLLQLQFTQVELMQSFSALRDPAKNLPLNQLTREDLLAWQEDMMPIL